MRDWEEWETKREIGVNKFIRENISEICFQTHIICLLDNELGYNIEHRSLM